jgi:predicted ATP-dependent serine protease
MSGDEGPTTAYTWQISAQDQQGGPGLDKDMKEQANWTQLEYWGDDGKPYLKEYEGRGLLENKAVLITGGDSGIGRSIAVLYAMEGADSFIAYLPEEEEDAKETVKLVEEKGQKCYTYPTDLKERENCKKVVEEAVKQMGGIDILVNNHAYQMMVEDIKDLDE